MRKLVFALALIAGAATWGVPAFADFDAGATAYRRGDFAAARAAFEPVAEAGDARAQALAADWLKRHPR